MYKLVYSTLIITTWPWLTGAKHLEDIRRLIAGNFDESHSQEMHPREDPKPGDNAYYS